MLNSVLYCSLCELKLLNVLNVLSDDENKGISLPEQTLDDNLVILLTIYVCTLYLNTYLVVLVSIFMYSFENAQNDCNFFLTFHYIYFLLLFKIRPQFFFRTADVTGDCTLPEKVEMVSK